MSLFSIIFVLFIFSFEAIQSLENMNSCSVQSSLYSSKKE